MKKHHILNIFIVLGLLFSGTSTASAQAFYNFQSITKHTVFFSISWQKKIVLGAGYAYRAGGDVQFTNISFEWKAPVDGYFEGKNFEAITGAYVRHSNGKGGIGTGYHFKLKKMSDEQKEATFAGLGLTILPGTLFGSAINSEDTGGSFAGRFTYTPTIYASVKDKTGDGSITNMAFAAHTIEAGLHLDILYKRTLAIAFNPVIAKTFTSEIFTFPDTPDWNFQADLYFGPTWWLDRE